MRRFVTRTLLLIAAIGLLASCADTTDRENQNFQTVNQAVSTSHKFSKAPSGEGGWESVAIDYDSHGNVYYAGTLFQDSSVDFGCNNTMTNPENSLDDAFLIKVGPQGTCHWQRKWGDSSDDSNFERVSMRGIDLTTTSDSVIIAYRQWYVPGSSSSRDPSVGGRVVEFDRSGGQIWSDHLGGQEGYEKEITAISVGEDRLVATGFHDVGFDFGSSTLPDPSASNDGDEAMILAWGRDDGSRTQDWGESFGGTGGNYPSDVSVHKPSNDIAVVGNYDDQHSHLGGGSADPATNRSFFIQTTDTSGNHLDAYGSTGNPAHPDDTESLASVDFAPSGDLFVVGSFHQKLQPNYPTSCTLVPNYCSGGNRPEPVAENSDADVDYFIAGLTSASNITDDFWFKFSDLNASNQTSPVIREETVAEVTATDNFVAVAGKVIDPTGEGNTPHGFSHVYDFTGNYRPPQPTTYSNFTKTYQDSDDDFYGSSVANSNERLLVGGTNEETNYSLGGSTLPGGNDFLVVYEFVN